MILETQISLLTAGTRIEGTFHFVENTRVHGQLHGTVHSAPGSILTLARSCQVEGTIHGSEIWIEGDVRGTIIADAKVVFLPNARFQGTVESPLLIVEPGAILQGKCKISRKNS